MNAMQSASSVEEYRGGRRVLLPALNLDVGVNGDSFADKLQWSYIVCIYITIHYLTLHLSGHKWCMNPMQWALMNRKEKSA
jgi:hypothetical protein